MKPSFIVILFLFVFVLRSFIICFSRVLGTNLIPAPTKNIGYSTERALNSTKSRESLQIYVTLPGTRACALKRIIEERESDADLGRISNNTRSIPAPTHKNIPSPLKKNAYDTHTSALII